jgi:predicted acyl esterase
MHKRLLALATATLLAFSGAIAAPAVAIGPPGRKAITAGAPQDYRDVKGLSKPRYETTRDSFTVPMKDGVEIYVEVVRPKKPGRYATILELSPYHGTLADRSGTRILPGPKKGGKPIGLAGYFAPRGYAVVFADLRGTGRSGGCLDHLGKLDQSDGREIVEWAAKQKWSNGRVGMTGHSYVGSTPQMTAAQKPPHLVTIVPSAGLGAMYHHEFQVGVPYFLQWAGPLFAYEQLSMERHLPGGDNEGGNMQYFGCGWQNSAAVTGEAYLSGAETQWHRDRDFAKAASKANIPVFNVHGVDDNAARTPGMDWFNDRRRAKFDKAWIGQWDHGSGTYPNNRTCPQPSTTECVNDQWTLALHAWFDKHLQQRKVDTGPAAEIFLNTREVFTANVWPPPVDETVTFFPNADGTMSSKAQGEDAGSVSYVADQRGFGNEFNTGNVSFETKPFTKDTLVVGIPTMRLTASVLGVTRVHLIASMYDVSGGEADLMGKAGFAINPELRDGIDKWQPVIPGEKMVMKLEGMAQAHVIEKGHKLRLMIASSHPDKVPTFAGGAHVTVYTGGKDGTTLSLPVIYNPKVYKDFFTTGSEQ